MKVVERSQIAPKSCEQTEKMHIHTNHTHFLYSNCTSFYTSALFYIQANVQRNAITPTHAVEKVQDELFYFIANDKKQNSRQECFFK